MKMMGLKTSSCKYREKAPEKKKSEAPIVADLGRTKHVNLKSGVCWGECMKYERTKCKVVYLIFKFNLSR